MSTHHNMIFYCLFVCLLIWKKAECLCDPEPPWRGTFKRMVSQAHMHKSQALAKG